MTEDTTPQSTLSEPTNEAVILLAQQLQAALMGLATTALCQEGKAAALAALDKIDAGQAELHGELRQHAGGLELAVWFASHGARQRLVHLRLTDPPMAGAAH